MRKISSISLLTILFIFNAFAEDNIYIEKSWGVGTVWRNATIPFDMEDDHVLTLVPIFFYEGDQFFMRGLDGGGHLYKNETSQFNILGRMRFFDIPEASQNEVQGDQIDIGVQWRTNFNKNVKLDVEIFNDLDGRFYGNITGNWYFEKGSWELIPSLTARFKSADFNSQYYSLFDTTNERIGAGIELNANVETRYHVASNFYLLGSVGISALDNNAYESSIVDQRLNSEVYLGFSFFNDKSKPQKESINSKGYFRISHGWATPSNIGDILVGGTVKDEHNNQLSSVFYGHPLTDELFNFPVDVYLTPGFVWHWNSEVQSSEQELVLGFKAFVTVPWPVRWRIGLAEGLSYVSNLTYIETTELEEKGYKGSELLNYVDLSFDINIGDVFSSPSLEHIWLGYSLHHRSAMFESASQFGRIKGGSNYNTVYLQFDF